MRIRAVLSATGLAAAALAVVPFSAAHADTGASGVALPLTSYYQMAVDSTHDHLFFSPGGSGNSILVTGFSGTTAATVTGQAGAMGIALSPDGSTLYAALSGAHEVTAISTATLEQTAAYPLGDTDTPISVAVQSGKLWVSYDTGTAGASAIGDFDLSAASPVLETQTAMGGWALTPMIAADPTGTGNVLVAIEPGTDSAAAAASYDTAADPVTPRAGKSVLTDDGDDNCYNATDLAVVPGGAQFAPACGSPYKQDLYSTADLSAQGSYAAKAFPNSIAFAASTGLVATGMEVSQPSIYVYKPGTDTPLNEFAPASGGAGTQGDGLLGRGLGLTADGSELFAIVGGNGTDRLYVYDEPAAQRTSLALSAPASEALGKTVTLSGTLRTAQSSPIAGAAITISGTGPGGKATLTATTGANGAFTATSTPSVPGTYTYTASYSGNVSLAPAGAVAYVTVPKLAPSLSISVTPKSATYRPVVHITVHLGTTKSDRTVYVYATAAGSTRRVLLKAGTVSSAGVMTLSYPATYTTTFSAEFDGDAVYGAKTVNATASVAASVTTKISGYYSGKRIGSVTYRLFHRTARLSAAVSVAPNKHGECVKFEVQEYFKGQWHAGQPAGCGTLGAQSTVGAYFTLGHADLGYHYRVRADYVRGSDVSNLNADSSWQYFVVEK